MTDTSTAFDDFVDDCFVKNDPICNVEKEKSLELVASRLISELLTAEEDDVIAA